jgi:biopolymer transport protein ExbD
MFFFSIWKELVPLVNVMLVLLVTVI